MDLAVDAEKIRSLRTARAWSQEHLAHVASIGRRTIQRVESSGKSSYETAQAIAAALDIEVSELVNHESLNASALMERNSLLRKIYVSSTSLFFLLLFALTRSVTADQVKLDIEALVDEQHETIASVTNEEGEGRRIQLAGNYRISITPTITTQGDVQLDIQLLKQIGDEYQQVGTPIVRTPDGETAMIKSATNNGSGITIEITPSIL